MHLIVIGDTEGYFKVILPQLRSSSNYNLLFFNDPIDGIASASINKAKGFIVNFEITSPSYLATLRLLKYSEELNLLKKVVFSQNPDIFSEQKALAAGADLFIALPMTPARILTALSQVFDL